MFIILFVHNLGEFVRNFASVFAIVSEVLWVEIREESIILLVRRGGWRGTEIVNKQLVSKLAVPNFVPIFDDLSERLLPSHKRVSGFPETGNLQI